MLQKGKMMEKAESTISKSENMLTGVDVLRLAASIAAVVLHSFLEFDRFADLYVASILVRWLVPIFFLISGYFLKTDTKEFVKFMGRLILVYVVWTVIYALLYGYNIWNPYDFASALRSGIVMPLWYYPTIIATLIFVWILAKTVKKPGIIILIGAVLFIGALIWNEFRYVPALAALQDSPVMMIHHKIFGEISSKGGLFWATLFVAIGYGLRNCKDGIIFKIRASVNELFASNNEVFGSGNESKGCEHANENLVKSRPGRKFWIILGVVFVLYAVEICVTNTFRAGDMDVLIMQIPFCTLLFIWALNCRIRKEFGIMLRGISTIIYLSHYFFLDLIRPVTGTGLFLALGTAVASFAFGWIIVRLSQKITPLKWIY